MSFSKSLIEKRDAALAKADAIVAAAQAEARELSPEQDAEIVAAPAKRAPLFTGTAANDAARENKLMIAPLYLTRARTRAVRF